MKKIEERIVEELTERLLDINGDMKSIEAIMDELLNEDENGKRKFARG